MKPVKILNNFLIENNGEEGVVIKQRKRLYVSAFKSNELDQYIADNFNILTAEGATSFRMPSEVKRVSEWTICNTDYQAVANLPPVNVVNTMEDLDIGVGYTRFFDYKNLTTIDGKPAINYEFYITFDSMDSEEMLASILNHYESYLALGITTVDYQYSSFTNYVSNDRINITVLAPAPTPIIAIDEALQHIEE